MSQSLAYLQEREWSMGTNQCPECCGHHPSWLGHLSTREENNIGHKPDCRLGLALRDLGENVVFVGEYVNTEEEERKWKQWREHYRRCYDELKPYLDRYKATIDEAVRMADPLQGNKNDS